MKSLEKLYEKDRSNNALVLSSINYHKSILATAIRGYNKKSDCECTVHPAFLTDKSFFGCQEDHFYQTSLLKSALEDYAHENNLVNKETLKLIRFLNETENEEISFKEYYSFYLDGKSFDMFSSSKSFSKFKNARTAVAGDCAWWCPLGCGSDHGCCGNYEGCCLYWHEVCWIHDKLCKNCEPREACFKGCKPDNPS